MIFLALGQSVELAQLSEQPLHLGDRARMRLARTLAVGLLIWGLPLVVLGLSPSVAGTLVLLGIVGIGNTLVDVAAITLLQRATPNEVLARVFGVLQSVMLFSWAIGGLVTPALIAVLGTEGTLVASGLALMVLGLLFWQRLRELDDMAAAPAHLELLEAVPIFAPLSRPALESLAAHLVPMSLPAGTPVVRAGEHGDRFYVLRAGEVEVRDQMGEAGVLGPGDYFGEIALLRDLPRTADVSALTDVELVALDRDHFVTAVTGHPASAEAADAIVATRLGGFRPTPSAR